MKTTLAILEIRKESTRDFKFFTQGNMPRKLRNRSYLFILILFSIVFYNQFLTKSKDEDKSVMVRKDMRTFSSRSNYSRRTYEDIFYIRNVQLNKHIDKFDVNKKRTCMGKKTNVAFLKVHKAGSTTVMNIFLRFAEAHKLNVIYPRPENYLGFDTTINISNILPPPENETYNILCNHVIYNKESFRTFMPKDTLFLAIVRDPVTQIISAAQFFDLFIDLRNKIGHLTGQQLMTSFLKNPDICSADEQKFVKTRMCRDFGITEDVLNSKNRLIESLKELSNDFLLVMVMERFDESLVLMKRYLCWDMKDIIYIPLNTLPKSRKERVVIKGDDLQNLKSYNWQDFLLYDFFKAIFIKRLQSEMNDFYDEVTTFKEILAQVDNYCKSRIEDDLRINRTRWNEDFSFSKKECEFVTMHEWDLLDMLKQKYKKRIKWKNK